MEVGGSIEDKYQKVFQKYPIFLKDWIHARNEYVMYIFLLILPFGENPIREVTQDLEKEVGFLKKFNGVILIQKKSLIQEPNDEEQASGGEEIGGMVHEQENALEEESGDSQEQEKDQCTFQPLVILSSSLALEEMVQKFVVE